MDLVEIRKKAKNKKPKAQKKKDPVIEAASDDSVQDGAAESAEEAPVTKKTPAQTVVEEDGNPANDAAVDAGRTPPASKAAVPDDTDDVDPLESLFALRVDGGLATEESYLQALMEQDEAADHDVEQWLTFSLADEEYALSIGSVSEIIKPRDVTEIPRVPGFIRGIISLRGIIVPVFDLNQRLHLGQAEIGASSRIIVCQDGERLAGFLVDRINQVVNVPLKNIEPPPTVLSGLDRDFVEGVGRVGNRMLILLHLSNVINAELV